MTILYRYFVKQVPIPYTYMKQFQCLRVKDGDARIPELKAEYYPIGWNVNIPHVFQPTKEDEAFKLKMHFRAWESEFKIVRLDEGEKL